MARSSSIRLVVAVLTAAACATGPRSSAPAAPAPGIPTYTSADVHFISGMIGHHAQAVLIAGWAPTHGASASVRVLCERIVVAQRDEIAFMQRWLREHHEAEMNHSTLMPGMLTPEQLAQLDSTRGPEFDRLFLADMIVHHEGALTMVEQLFGAQGAGQDGPVFRFAADVNADQSSEIDRMTRMLAALDRSP